MGKPVRYMYIVIFFLFLAVPMAACGILRRQAWKEELLYVNARINSDVFHMSSSQDVILGKDGWLFYQGRQESVENPVLDYTGENLFTEEELQTIADNMTQSMEKAKEAGAVFLVVLAPNKERVYSEYLPDGFGPPAENCRLAQVRDYLKTHTEVPVIDTCEVLQTYHAAHPEERLFIKHDTHWNFQGSYLAADAILRYLGDPLPELETLGRVEVAPPPGDLSNLMGFGERYQAEPEYMLTGYSDQPATATINTTFEHAYVKEGETPHRSLLIAGDSFSVAVIPYLACHFQTSYMNFHYNYTEQMIADHQPDVIIYEVLERFLGYMLTFRL